MLMPLESRITNQKMNTGSIRVEGSRVESTHEGKQSVRTVQIQPIYQYKTCNGISVYIQLASLYLVLLILP